MVMSKAGFQTRHYSESQLALGGVISPGKARPHSVKLSQHTENKARETGFLLDSQGFCRASEGHLLTQVCWEPPGSHVLLQSPQPSGTEMTHVGHLVLCSHRKDTASL